MGKVGTLALGERILLSESGCIFYSPGGEGRINRVLNFRFTASWHGMSVSFSLVGKLNPGLTTIKKFLERGLFMKYIK